MRSEKYGITVKALSSSEDLMLSKMGAKGRNILELLVEKYKEGNN